LRLLKTLDGAGWRKVGEMSTPLGKRFLLYESLDGSRVAQVDEEGVVQLIVEGGRAIYIDSRVVDVMVRVAELKAYLEGSVSRPDL